MNANEYLAAAFPEDLLLPDERPVVAYPDSFISRDTGKQVEFYRQFHPRGPLPADKATYFCVSTAERQRKRQVKKRLEDVRTAFVIGVDDIIGKCKAPQVRPTAIIETSENNFQWHYFIEPYDVSTPEGQAYYDSVLYSLAEAGHNDPGFRSASRLARLPGSLHRTGFRARVTEFDDARVWDLEDLASAFKVPLKKPRKTFALRPGKHDRLEDVEDPVYDWLADNWTIYGHNDQWLYIECPWRHTHTEGQQGKSSTAYSPQDYGRAGAGFKCLHGHCGKRRLDDFITFIFSEKNK